MRQTEEGRRMGDFYALDFDGIFCDTCGESSLSAVKAAKVRWSNMFKGVDSLTEDRIVDQMHTTGGRNWVRKCFTGEAVAGDEKSFCSEVLGGCGPDISCSGFKVAVGLAVEEILDNWSKIKPVIMEEWDKKRDPLIELFGKIRDEWIKTDFATWIGANRFYPCVPDALKFASSKIYIITTKWGLLTNNELERTSRSPHGVALQMRCFENYLGVSIPEERLYGLGTGPKVEALKKLQQMPEHQGLRLHFVEDRLATLKNVIKEPELDKWNLYLGES